MAITECRGDVCFTGWIVISFSRESSQPRGWTLCPCRVSCLAGGFFAAEPQGSPILPDWWLNIIEYIIPKHGQCSNADYSDAYSLAARYPTEERLEFLVLELISISHTCDKAPFHIRCQSSSTSYKEGEDEWTINERKTIFEVFFFFYWFLMTFTEWYFFSEHLQNSFSTKSNQIVFLQCLQLYIDSVRREMRLLISSIHSSTRHKCVKVLIAWPP